LLETINSSAPLRKTPPPPVPPPRSALAPPQAPLRRNLSPLRAPQTHEEGAQRPIPAPRRAPGATVPIPRPKSSIIIPVSPPEGEDKESVFFSLEAPPRGLKRSASPLGEKPTSLRNNAILDEIEKLKDRYFSNSELTADLPVKAIEFIATLPEADEIAMVSLYRIGDFQPHVVFNCAETHSEMNESPKAVVRMITRKKTVDVDQSGWTAVVKELWVQLFKIKAWSAGK
jgi:hypothetical protein